MIDQYRARRWKAQLVSDSDLAHTLCGVGDELVLPAAAKFRVVVNGQPLPTNGRVRDEIRHIASEALSNASRHAAATSLEIEIEYSACLRVLVRDNGRGIDPHAVQPKHNGLSGMRERAEQIGARLRVWSRLGAGTEVEVLVPGSVAFAT